MKVTLTTHAKERIQERVKLNTFSNVVDIKPAITTCKYKKADTNANVINVVSAMNNKLVLFVIDADTKEALTVMTEGYYFDRQVNKAKMIMKQKAA